MEHDLELIIARLEVLEIEVCNILQNPGNIGKLIFFDSVLPWKYWKFDFFQFSHILEILEICFFYILGFFKKRRAPKFHAEWSGFRAEISHMRPIQGQKLKLFQPPILPLFFPSSKPLATTMFHVLQGC